VVDERRAKVFSCQATMSSRSFRNQILCRLAPETIKRLELQPVALPLDREIEFPGQSIDHLFFLEDGMASMTTTFLDGFQVEVALIGVEGVLGASCMIGTKRSLNRVYMQAAGQGYSSASILGRREFARHGVFHDLTLRYLQAQFIQSAQTAGCNAHHEVLQRLARWLLLTAERLHASELRLSHEYMADMIGARRSTVTVMAGQLKARGLISYKRGHIVILDRKGLEAASCECYRVVRGHMNDLTDYDKTLE
jgi:CRP-like cAMP-binding protein